MRSRASSKSSRQRCHLLTRLFTACLLEGTILQVRHSNFEEPHMPLQLNDPSLIETYPSNEQNGNSSGHSDWMKYLFYALWIGISGVLAWFVLTAVYAVLWPAMSQLGSVLGAGTGFHPFVTFVAVVASLFLSLGLAVWRIYGTGKWLGLVEVGMGLGVSAHSVQKSVEEQTLFALSGFFAGGLIGMVGFERIF